MKHAGVYQEEGIQSKADRVRREQEEAGYKLSDEEYEEVLEYTDRKRILCSKPKDYFTLLLEDEIRNKVVRETINAISMLRMAAAE